MDRPDRQDEADFVSRGGLKLQHALDAFRLDPAGLVCADLGCSTGGFTDCLLARGAARVFAVDTAYGQLAWRLRNHPDVTVMERRNALHVEPPEPVDLVVVDLGWTRQDKAVPAALAWLKPSGRIVSLVKPHYEAPRARLRPGGVLEPADAERIALDVRDRLPALGVRVAGWTKSPVLGGAVSGKRKRKGSGNPEWLVLLDPAEPGEIP